jgi:hypothetical protein
MHAAVTLLHLLYAIEQVLLCPAFMTSIKVVVPKQEEADGDDSTAGGC